MFDGIQILSNTTKHDQTAANQHQTRWPNGEMFGHQTLMVFGRQTFARLDRPSR